MFPIYNHKVVDKPGPAFRSIEYVSTNPTLDTKFYDNLNYDDEVNRLLDEVEEEFLRDKPKNYDFPEDTHHVGSIPDWYRDMLKNKIQEAKSRLENLSNLVCATSPSTAAHIKRIEEDHSTAFCKMDYPRHPPMHKSWRSTWEFCYVQKCKETDLSNHSHLVDCKDVLVEDVETGVRVNSPNVSQHDYPPHVVCAARLFENFARNLYRRIYKSKMKEKSECEEKPESKKKSKSKGMLNVGKIKDDWWTTMSMVLISNHLNELMIVVRRENVKGFIPHLKLYFQSVIKAHPNIVSILAAPHAKMNVNMTNWLKKLFKANKHKENRFELLIAGTPVLKDEIGPLSMEYDLANHRVFLDSIETMQLGKVIQDYMCLTKETTLLDIGSNFGVLSLIMAHKCEQVIKFISEPQAQLLMNELEKWKNANGIHNVFFTGFKKMVSRCEPLINQCITVVIVKLNSMSIYQGRLNYVMKALRNLRSIWRVILYGSFTDQFHESIAVLTSEDDSMGERYLPMQGCILDKSPTIVNAFDIVILFERKSLIAPKVKLFAPGPTVNVAVDSETSDDDLMDAQESSLDGDRELANSEEKCEERLSLSTSDQRVPSLSELKEFRFDRPPPPLGTIPPFSNPPPSVTEKFQFDIPPPPVHPNPSDQVREDLQNDYPRLESRYPNPHFHPEPYLPMGEDFQNDYPLLDSRFPNPRFHREPYPPMREDFQNDYPPSLLDSRFPNPHFHPEPYPPIREDLPFNCLFPLFERYSDGPIHPGPHAPMRDDFQDHYYPPLPPENYYNPLHHLEPYPVINNEFQNRYQLPPPSLPPPQHSFLLKNKKSKKKNVKPHFFYPPPPPTRFPSPPPPPPVPPLEEIDLIEKESNTSSASTSVIDVSLRVCEEEKVREVVNTEVNLISSVVIKSEPIDPSYSTVFSGANSTLSEANCDSPTITVKDKLIQVCEEKASEVIHTAEDIMSSISIKSEPIDSSYSGELLEEKRHSQTAIVKDELVQVCEETASEIVNTDLISRVRIKSEPTDPSYAADVLEDNYILSKACCYSSTTIVTTEPLQDEVKKESNVADCGTNLKAEVLHDDEKKESNVANFEALSSITIKSETTNQSSSVNFSDTNCQNIPLPMTVNSESTNFSPIRSPDCESMDMQISPSPPDFQSMETPIHNPRALSDITPMSVSKNVSMDGSEFPVQTNQTFLGKVEPVDIDREPGEISDSDGENEAIGEEKNKAPIISRKLNRPPRPFPGKYSESSNKRQKHRRSPSPKRMRRSSPLDKRRRRLPIPDKRRRRSPLSDRRRERSRRSPLREARGRARSPRDRRNRRSRSRSPRRR